MKRPIELKLLLEDQLTKEEIEQFRKQGVCMDDWDYMLLVPIHVAEYECVEDTSAPQGQKEGEDNQGNRNRDQEQLDERLNRLLTGCCTNRWYTADFRGVPYTIGVAYHS